MENLWLLTEERPKTSVVLQIIEMYCNDFNDVVLEKDNIKIKPIIENMVFKFIYHIEGLKLKNSGEIYIKTVSGNSSFIDFLLFKQDNEPNTYNTDDNLIMAIEETKTSDDESRNTGVYQRGSKFVYIEQYYNNVRKYMLYNEELNARDKKPSDTSIFGTNILLTLGVKIVGKSISKWFQPYTSIDEMIDFKDKMRKAPAGNVPITLTKYDDRIEVSGRLEKPAGSGNIGHDPNIGALSMISKCIRQLGWTKDIVITHHGVTQTYIDKTRGKNKFLYICKLLGLKLKDIVLPPAPAFPEWYWHYEMSSEKMTSILLHMTALYSGLHTVYENHAGCERGYFKDMTNKQITLPKKDKNGVNLFLPDVVLYDSKTNYVLLVEGKKLSTLKDGLNEIKLYDSIENEFINVFYPHPTIKRCVSIFGGNENEIPCDDVLIYMGNTGNIILNENSPEFLKEAFNNINMISENV